MEFSVKSGQPEKQRTSCLIVAVFSTRRLSSAANKIDQVSEGMLSNLMRRGDCEGKVGQTLLLHNVPGILAERLLLVGCGKEGELNELQFREILTKVMQTLTETGTTEAVSLLTQANVKNKDLSGTIRLTQQTIHDVFYRFENCKSQKGQTKKLFRDFIFLVPTTRLVNEAKKAIEIGNAIVQGIETTKNLANLPANICTPSYLADFSKQFAKKHAKLSAAILEEKDMQALGMGALLSVTQGSEAPAKLITLEYRGAKKDSKPIVLVGKGITFDTGGNSIKVPPNMVGMKYDMCGAATVIGVLTAAIELGLPLNIIGVIPTCENRIGPNATRPEDIVTSLSGLTVEILNTDAEGRLILADALTYCERFHPDVVIDVATLTGACSIALGFHASGLMSNHEPLANALLQAGTQSSDRAWQLPLWDEYHEALKSDFADISNIPYTDVGARTIIAGCFLSKFAQKFHWAHLDVANTASNVAGKRGATGRPVPLIVQYLLNRCQ